MAEARRVLITGASSGIGRYAALRMIDKGHRLTLICRNRQRAAETLNWINVEYRGWAPRGRRRKRLFFGRRGGRLVNNDGSPGGGRRLVDHDIVGGGAIIAATTRTGENGNNEQAGREHDPA